MSTPDQVHPLFFGAANNPNSAVWITGSNLGPHVQLKAVRIRLQATASTPITYNLVNGSLPVGITLNSATGIITGTMPPVTVDTPYQFTVDAYTNGYHSYRTFSLIDTVAEENQPLWQTPAGNVGNGNANDILVVNLLAIDPTGDPIGYRLTGNTALPPGLNLNTSTGVISGYLPAVLADTIYTFTVNATNGFYNVPRTFNIEVFLVPTIYWITPAGTFLVALQNTAISSPLLATSPENLPVTYTIVDGALPNGIYLDSNSGSVYGTLPYAANASGDIYTFTVVATDGTLSQNRSFSITVLETTAAVDPFADYILILMHFDGADSKSTFIDTTGNPAQASGHAITSAYHSLFGGTSLYLDGASSVINTPRTGHNFDLSATDYTIEFANLWETIPTSNVSLFQISNKDLTVSYGNNAINILTYVNGTTHQNTVFYPWTPFPYVWTRLAVVSANSVVTVYVDGSAVGNATINFKNGGASSYATIGSDNLGHYNNGYIDELRVTRAARYLGNYTPSNVPFPDIPYWITTSLLPAYSEVVYQSNLVGSDPNGEGLFFTVANGSVLPLNLDVANPQPTGSIGSLEGIPQYTNTTNTYSFTLHLTDGYNGVDQTFNNTFQVVRNPGPTIISPTLSIPSANVAINQIIDPNNITPPIDTTSASANVSAFNLGTFIVGYPVDAPIAISYAFPSHLVFNLEGNSVLTDPLQLGMHNGVVYGVAPNTVTTNVAGVTSNIAISSNVVYIFAANIGVDNQAQSVSANFIIEIDYDYPPVFNVAVLNTTPNTTTVPINQGP